MAARIRAFDWAKTPLGPIEVWPQSLKTAVDILLASGHAMQLAWGPQKIVLYNDAYTPMLGDYHPGALGIPFNKAWPDVWAAIKPLVERAFAGETVRHEDLLLVMQRHGYPEDTWWNFSYSPVRDESGAVAGLLNVTVDATPRVRAERAERQRDEANARLQISESRQAFLLTLSDALRPLADPSEMKAVAMHLLGEHLGLNRAFYADAEGDHWRVTKGYERDIEPLPDQPFDMEEYGSWIIDGFKAGERLVVSNMATDARFRRAERDAHLALQIGAEVALPLIKDGQVVAVLVVHTLGPREWSGQDLTILEETAERTWAAVERARAEAALRERGAELARVQRVGGIGGINIDIVDGLRGWRSPEYLRLHGLPADKVVETHEEWLARIVPDDRDSANATLFSALNSDAATYENEYRIVRPSDGNVRWIFARADIERDASGKPLRVVGAHIDITDRKQTEEALRQSEHRLRLALEAGRMGIWSFDIGSGKQEWSDGQFEIFGLSPGSSPPTRDEFLKLVHPEDLHLVEFTENDTRPEGTALDSEFRIVRPDGEVRWVSAHSLARFGRDGRPVELIGVNYDITDRRRQEEALRTTEERLREFGDASSDVLWIRDAETLQWEYLSPAFERIYGISRQDALRGDHYGSWMDLIVEEDRQRAAENIEKVRRGKRTAFEYRVRRPVNGEIRWLRNTDFPMRDERGEVKRIGGVGHDITALKAAEEHQRILLAELQHRVRNTLAVIRSIARRTAESSESVEDYAMHLDGRISAFSRVQSAVTRNPAAGIELGGIVLDELGAHGARQGGQIDVQGPRVHLTAKAAETLGLTMHELATNAVKHGALSLPRGEVKVTWRREPAEGGGESLVLIWQESGLPGGQIVPKRRGFGTELLERTLAHEFKAEVSQVFQKGGLHCTIRLPVTAKLLADFQGMGTAKKSG